MKIIIIGAGPAGYETALEAASKGIEVVLVEGGQVGGTCLNRGCIPTKALCRSAEVWEIFDRAPEFGISYEGAKLDFAAVMDRKNAIVQQLRSGVDGLLKHKLITRVQGWARLKDAYTVCVATESGEVEHGADYIIIATGSTPAMLPIEGADLEGVITSDELLQIDSVPNSLCIIGAGVIGLEFASIFNSFGSKVTVLEFCKDVLPRFDTDLAKRLKQSLSKSGIDIQTQTGVKAIRKGENGLEVIYERKGELLCHVTDKVLMAVGRRPAISGLGLEEVGVDATPRGIIVNEFGQTNIPSIYAIGDARGGIMLAHAATAQGRKALRHICGVSDEIDLSIIPAAVFTMPEAATVGLTENECKEKGLAISCHKSFFRANGKAVCLGETEGYCKIIEDARSGRILGCHLIGPHAADLVQEVSGLMARATTYAQFKDMIHAHPTLSEVLV